MSSNIIDWFGDFATFPAFARVMFGYAAGLVSYWAWCRHKKKKFMLNWRYVGIAVGICVIIGMSVQTQVAYNIAASTASEVQDCQREFQQAIQTSRDIANQNDELSVQQRDLLAEKDRLETAMWIKILSPPDPIGSMDINDPIRQKYGVAVVREYADAAGVIDVKVKAITDKQDELKAKRPPLPEPTCGMQ